jgi:hypothetical protein
VVRGIDLGRHPLADGVLGPLPQPGPEGGQQLLAGGRVARPGGHNQIVHTNVSSEIPKCGSEKAFE